MDDHCRRHIWHVPAQTQQTSWFLFSWIKGFELSTSLFSHDFWVFHMQSSKKTCLSWFHMMISYFVMGKPEILHSSQPRKAFRPRPKKCGNPDIGGLWWRSLGEKNAISSLCWSVLRHVEIDLCGKKWRGDPSRDNIADIHRLITDVLQLDNDTKKCWFLEEFVAANIMGIVGILHMLSCKRTHSIWEFFFWHFDDFRCNVWAKVYEMAWSTLVFSSVFWDTWRPIRLGAPSHNDVWTGGHTQASGQAYAKIA